MNRLALTLLCAIALLSAAPVRAECNLAAVRAGDKWIAEDKALHASASYVAGMASKDLLYTRSDWAAWGLAMLPGTIKEATDARSSCNRWSWKDMVWNGLGALLGVKWRGWIVTPQTIGYEATW